LVEDTLADLGCAVVGPFDTVSDALVAARNDAIDFAILDVNVAGSMVYPVAEALEMRNIPFLFLSGYGRQALPDDRPAWRVCTKPFTPGELIAALVQHLTESR
jgi:DNA-binding response OmpR family regulator